jgi:hypothetical protein
MAGIFALGRRAAIEDIRIIVHKLLAGFDVVDGTIQIRPSSITASQWAHRGLRNRVVIYGGIDDVASSMATNRCDGGLRRRRDSGHPIRRCYALTGIFDEPGPGEM